MHRDREQLAECKSFMEATYRRLITIESLSREFGLNQDKLKSGFKAMYGYSIHQYLIKLRMEKGRELLLSSDDPIKQIASLVGCRPRSFFTSFQKYFGCSPHAYRLSQGQPILI